MKTFTAKPESVQRDWFVVDATGKTLGRIATEIALRLRGKHKPEYTPHVDTGDYIIVVNADKVTVTGNKAKTKCTTLTVVSLVVSKKLTLKTAGEEAGDGIGSSRSPTAHREAETAKAHRG